MTTKQVEERFSNKEDPAVLKKAEKLIQKSKNGIVLFQVFYAFLMSKLEFIADWNAVTAYTDGRVIGYNPNYIVSLTVEEARSLVVHEIKHCAFGHHLRRGGRHITKWNYAADYAINWMIKELTGFSLSEGALYSSAFADKSSEWIYAQLPEPEKGASNDCGGMGEVRDWTNEDGKKPSEADVKKEEGQWRVAVSQAHSIARSAGKLPAGIDRWVKDFLKPKVNVEALLVHFLTESIKGDFSWKMPNQRYLQATGIYLPSLQPTINKLQRGAYIVDTSGSITDGEMKDTASIIWEVITKFDMELDVFSVDCKLQKHEVVGAFSDPNKLKFKGGGGTCFRPAFKKMDKDGIDPLFAIYFTDGQCDTYPSKKPWYPVIWLLHKKNRDFKPPFGTVVRMDG